jgi:geranylgeranyl diphosphate synthase type I
MRVEMAAGQLLDLEMARAAESPDEAARRRIAALKTGSYTAEGPVLIGAALADAGPNVEGPLQVYARSLGDAFQLRDDIIDGEAPSEAASRVDELASRAIAALQSGTLDAVGRDALVEIASALRVAG